LLPGDPSRLAAFDPGEISVKAEGEEIVLEYSLGLRPQYSLLGLLTLCVVVLLLVATTTIAIFAASGGLMIFLAATAYSLMKLRAWLKAAAVRAIAGARAI